MTIPIAVFLLSVLIWFIGAGMVWYLMVTDKGDD